VTGLKPGLHLLPVRWSKKSKTFGKKGFFFFRFCTANRKKVCLSGEPQFFGPRPQVCTAAFPTTWCFGSQEIPSRAFFPPTSSLTKFNYWHHGLGVETRQKTTFFSSTSLFTAKLGPVPPFWDFPFPKKVRARFEGRFFLHNGGDFCSDCLLLTRPNHTFAC